MDIPGGSKGFCWFSTLFKISFFKGHFVISLGLKRIRDQITDPAHKVIFCSRREDDDPRPLLHAVGVHAARVLSARQLPGQDQDAAARHRQVEGGAAVVGQAGAVIIKGQNVCLFTSANGWSGQMA